MKKSKGPSLSEFGVNTEEIITGLTEIVEETQANSAEWSIDDWKEAYRAINLYSIPVVVFSAQLTAAIQTQGDKAESQFGRATEELALFNEKFAELTQAFLAIASETGAAQAIAEDADFQQELKEKTLAAMQE